MRDLFLRGVPDLLKIEKNEGITSSSAPNAFIDDSPPFLSYNKSWRYFQETQKNTDYQDTMQLNASTGPQTLFAIYYKSLLSPVIVAPQADELDDSIWPSAVKLLREEVDNFAKILNVLDSDGFFINSGKSEPFENDFMVRFWPTNKRIPPDHQRNTQTVDTLDAL
ncbi:hypothetical protein ARMGADRAFT_1036675 [Armillaria gallica]|uniref:Uncharacterized protein n=1 Tax=Armillaria gallica TaxID=47427 RepID=A0A2H3D9K8_ARMGA|nr:hypothetical protein ARMGADRAFT_1036675 [Armillaria gallica]